MKNVNALDKNGREAAVYLLREAKKIIKSGERVFVCFALILASYHDRVDRSKHKYYTDDALDALTKDIDDALGPGHGYVTDWLLSFHRIRLSASDAKKYRMAWIDQMISLIKK